MKTLALIVAVLGFGWLVTRKPKRKVVVPKAPPVVPPSPIPEGPPPPLPPPTGRYVGSGWTGWPHKDQFPDEASFGRTLQKLGYVPGYWSREGYTVLDDATRQAVRGFQADFNYVSKYRRHAREAGLEEKLAPFSPPIRADLAVDGLLGPATIPALYDAQVYEVDVGMEWYKIVQAIKADMPVA